MESGSAGPLPPDGQSRFAERVILAEQWTPGDAHVTATTTTETVQGPMVVRARASLEPARAALETLKSVLVPGIPALLLLVAALTWLAVGRALRPVSAIRSEMADITASDLHRRVPVPRARDEIARLAETMNRTLDRLELAVDRHRRFVADAAHELRSPLAILRTRLELAPPGPLTAETLTDVDRIQALTSDLLLLARLDAGEPDRHEEADLGQITAEEAARSRPRPEVRVVLEIAADVVVLGSAERLRRLVANLVDNAVRHAESAVTVRLAREDGVAVLEVRDDGPGIPDEHRETVFDRFTRLDEARDRDAGGSGLGLAIARDIAVRHGGTLAVVPGPPGPACAPGSPPPRRSAAGHQRHPGAGFLAVLPEPAERGERRAVPADQDQPVAELDVHAGVLLVVLAGPGDQMVVVRPGDELLDPVPGHRPQRGQRAGPEVLHGRGRLLVRRVGRQPPAARGRTGLLETAVLLLSGTGCAFPSRS
nr:hypothetical protein GCM10020093_076600 [Planobispora longispora]